MKESLKGIVVLTEKSIFLSKIELITRLRMKNTKFFLLLAILLTVVHSAYADSFFSKHVDIDNGLSQPSVTCILSDRQGAIWIGTRFGLNKYRSNAITNFGTKPSDKSDLKGSYVLSLYLDGNDKLWASTEQGLSVKDTHSDHFSLVAGGTKVYSATETTDKIFFGSTEGIHIYDKENQKFLPKEIPLEGSFIIRIIPFEDGKYLVVDRGLGLFIFSPEEKTLSPVEIPFKEHAIIMDGCLYEGLLYLAVYNKGLYAVDPRTGEIKRFYNRENSGLTFNVVLTLLEIDGRLWMGTDGGGICTLDRGEISRLDNFGGADKDIIANGSFTCLYEDSLGAIWAGSVRNGAFSFKTSDIRLFTHPFIQTGCAINSIWKGKDGMVWIGTDGAGVSKYSPSDAVLSNHPDSEGTKVHSLTEFDSNHLLLSIYSQGLYVHDKVTGKNKRFLIESPQVDAQESRSGCSPMLFTTEDGKVLIFGIRAYIYDPASKVFTRFHEGDKTPDISEMILFGEDSHGYYYSFSKNGLFRLDVKRAIAEQILALPADEPVKTAALASNGTIWLGTDDGLKYILPGEKVLNVYQTNLFRRVTQLKTWRDSHMWIAADNLLFNMDENGQMVILDESDGFTANEIIASSLSNTVNDPVIFLGGTRGFVEVNSEINSSSVKPLELELYEVTSGDKRIACETGGRISIPWRYKSLMIGINLRGIEPYRKELYRFVITGRGHTFETVTYQDKIPLAGLTDGLYHVGVSYHKRDGSWSEMVNVLDIRITPPWYRSWWFYCLFILAIISAIAFLVFEYNEQSKKTLADTLSRWVTTSVDYSEEQASSTLSPQERDIIKKVNRYVEEHLADVNLNVSAIATEAAMSRASLYSKVKSITGMGVAQYVEDIRIRRACHLLKETELSVAEISEQVGFSTPNYFSMRFKQAVGISPLTFRKNMPHN